MKLVNMIEVKLIIKILKFLGLIKDNEVSINIPSCYSLNVKVGNFWENNIYIINDIFEQIYHKIETDKKFKKRCKYVKYINASFQMQ